MPLPRLTFSFIVQTNNYREMPDFVLLGKKYAADSVNFTHLAPGPLGADDYRREAIHRTNNPAHQDLLRVMAHPLISDPICYVANLSPFLPARRMAAGAAGRERLLSYTSRLRSRGNWLDWEDFRDALLLDGAQAAAVRECLGRLHDATRRILLIEPAQGASPAAFMLDGAAHSRANAALDRFHAYLRQTLCPETNTSYAVALARVEMDARAEITRVLRAEQAESLGGLRIENISLVDIGRDAYSEAVNHLREQRGGHGPLWERLAAACGMDPEQRFIGGAMLEDFKARWLQIADTCADGGGPSPFQQLIEALRAGQQSPHLVLVDALAHTRDAGSGVPLSERISDLENRTRVKVLSLLEPEQREKFSALAPASLSGIQLAEDPVEQAVRGALSEPSAVRATLASCGN